MTPPEIAAAIAAKRAVVDEQDLFEVLGVAREADRAAIKAAYLEAARTFHPDSVAAVGLLHLRAEADHIFRRLSEAHATLSDDRRRAIYLERLDQSPEVLAQQAQAHQIVAGELAFRQGEQALKRRDVTAALDHLAEAARLDPTDGEAQGFLAWARFRNGTMTLAEVRKELEEAVGKAPRSARIHYYLGMARKQAGAIEGALASFRKAVELDPYLTEAASELRLLQSRQAAASEPRSLWRRLVEWLRAISKR